MHLAVDLLAARRVRTRLPDLINSVCTVSILLIAIGTFVVVLWWAHQGSNLGPSGYEPVALPIELWAPEAPNYIFVCRSLSMVPLVHPMPVVRRQ